MCGLSEDSLLKCKQMSMGSWVKAFWKLSALKKMPWWKGILLSLWKVRVLRRFLDKMQSNVYGKLDESLLFNLRGNCGLSKMPWWKVILLSLWKVRVLRRFLVKFQQLSMGSWVNASCLISGETAGSQKMCWWKVIFLSISVEKVGC